VPSGILLVPSVIPLGHCVADKVMASLFGSHRDPR
jgi:hypothetical protein